MVSPKSCSFPAERKRLSRLIRALPAYRVCIAYFVFISFLVAGWGGVPLCEAPPTPAAEPPESIVAIGDVHNDFDDFVAILRRTSVINQENHWIAGRTTFVQVGDLLDRGPKPREVMDLVMALEKEAAQAGGRVVSLLGNHEMMNMMGDLRYVVPANYASFADAKSADRQKAAYNEYVEWRNKHAALVAELQQPMELTETEWMARHPLGFVEQREALGPKGKYGEWLRGHAAVAEIEGVVFLHGGIHPRTFGRTVHHPRSAGGSHRGTQIAFRKHRAPGKNPGIFEARRVAERTCGWPAVVSRLRSVVR